MNYRRMAIVEAIRDGLIFSYVIGAFVLVYYFACEFGLN